MGNGHHERRKYKSKKLLTFLQADVPQLREDYFNAVQDAKEWGHDVKFTTKNCKFIKDGFSKVFQPEFFAWVESLTEYLGIIGVGYKPDPGELSRLDFRAMNVLKNQRGNHAGVE